MKRKLLIGILVVLGITVAVLNPLIGGIFAVGGWIYLFRMVRKQKDSVFNDQMESKISEWHLKRLKAFLVIAGILFLLFLIVDIAHNVYFEESFFFIFALVALWLFIISTIAGLVISIKGREKTTQ